MTVLHDLVQTEAVYVSLDLYPDLEVVGELKAQLVARHPLPRKKFPNVGFKSKSWARETRPSYETIRRNTIVQVTGGGMKRGTIA